jgi:hypothetical protein
MNNVQLILYPQFFNGQFNEISTNANQFVVDGNNFNSLNASESYDVNLAADPVNTTISNALVNLNPNIPNTWYRYRSVVGATPTLPTQSSGAITLYGAASTVVSGVYQELTNLVAGQEYRVSILTNNASASGFLYINTYNIIGTSVILKSSALLSTASAGKKTTVFTAASSSEILVISYRDGSSTNLVIADISVTPKAISPSATTNIIASGEVICDLYEDEDIPLTLSVDNFKNVAEKVQSYSKAFKLPATKKNNKIFDNIFEVTRTADGLVFNAYVKTQCKLKQDGFLLFEGYLRLIEIQDKQGEISYNVNLYSEVIAFADVLKEKKFSDLDFSELLHVYNFDNIKASWQSAGGLGLVLDNPLPTGTYAGTAGTSVTTVLKYPFCNWENSITIANGIQPNLPNLESAFRPFINIKYCLDRIFETTPFTYTSNFFSSNPDFQKLFMDFNWGAEVNPQLTQGGARIGKTFPADTALYATTSYTTFKLNELFPAVRSEFGFDAATGIFTVPANQENSTYMINYNCRVIAKKDATVEFKWVVNAGTATEATYNYETATLEGSAVASLGIDKSCSPTDCLAYVDVRQGGYYPGAVPTVTIEANTLPATPTTLTATVVGNEVTAVAISGDTHGYELSDNHTVLFNGINPRYNYQGMLNSAFGGITLQPGDTLQLQWKASAADSIRQDDTINYWKDSSYSAKRDIAWVPMTSSIFNCNISVLAMTDDILLQTLRGDLGQWEFIKGLMTMFNLVSLPDKNNPNNILIEPYADVFVKETNSGSLGDMTIASRSIAHDWTEKIDVAEIKLKPLTDLNKTTIFKYAEDGEDAAFEIYKNAVQNHLYGSKVYDASGFTVLQGVDEIVAEPFAATIVKPIIPNWGSLLIPAIYGMDDDNVPSGIDNAPRILYDCGVKTLSGYTYIVPYQNGVGSSTQSTFLQFSHLTQSKPTDATTVDFNFGECQLIPPTGNAVSSNLFNTYWLPYYSQLYNSDTRIMTLKVDLRASDINTFDFADTVFIKNREYRVNKIDYKPNDLSIVEFILTP